MTEDVFNLLASAREPRSTASLWDEITLGGRREPPAGLPRRLGELSNVVMALIVAGRIEERDGLLYVVRQAVKAERTLF